MSGSASPPPSTDRPATDARPPPSSSSPEGSRRIAAIDVGTNTVMCLIADAGPGQALTVIADEERFARLGEGVDAEGMISDDAMDRVVQRLSECLATAMRHDAQAIVVCATSASRDARNIDQLIQRVKAELGMSYRVIPGDEEGALSFRGALALLPEISEACVLDVGGGSTEMVAGSAERMDFRRSLQIGSVRIAERYFSDGGDAAVGVHRAEMDIRQALNQIHDKAFGELPLVECGGTARVLAALTGSDEPAPRIPIQTVLEWRDRLLSMQPDDIRALQPRLLTGREDLAGPALLILHAVMQRFGFASFVAAEGGLRHGIALHYAGSSDQS